MAVIAGRVTGGRSVRPALVGAAGLLVGALGGSVFDAFVWEFVVAAAIVAAVALVSEPASTTVRAASVIGSVVVGVAAAVVLAGGSAADALWGVRGGPRRLLSTEWPSPAEPTLVAAVALLVAAATALGVVSAQHRRWRLAPLVPLLVAVTVVMALSAPVRPAPWLAAMLATVCLAAALEVSDAPAPGGPVLVSVGVVVLVAIGVSTLVGFSDRADPRTTDDAVASAVLLDPVEATVAMRDADPVVELLTILVDGPGIWPSRWRTSAFDTYDGQRWTPEVDLRPIGGRLAEPPSTGPARPPIGYEVRYLDRSLDLVPTPGRPLAVDRDVDTDLDRVVVRLVERPDDTTSVTASALPAPTVAEAAEVGLADRQVDELAAAFTEQARTLAGEGTRLEQLVRLAATMHDWQLDSAAPGAGQQLTLIDRFVSDTRRGTREQFVTGFVLLARSLGADARIAIGFVVPADGEPALVRTDDAAVWPEVRLANGDWLALDPVPTSEAVDTDEPPPPPDAQTPAAAQPPIAPPVDDPGRDGDSVAEPGGAGDGWGTFRTWLVRGALTAGIALGPLLTALAAIVAVKWKRRRRRAAASDPATLVRGYWANATDSLVDAGLTIEAAWTDDTIATAAVDVLAGPTHEARRLAAMAAAVTFGSPGGPEARLLADDAAASCAALDGLIRSSRTRWERARWRLSLRSLRRPTRSPVTA